MEMKWKSDSEKKANNLFDEDDKNLVVCRCRKCFLVNLMSPPYFLLNKIPQKPKKWTGTKIGNSVRDCNCLFVQQSFITYSLKYDPFFQNNSD